VSRVTFRYRPDQPPVLRNVSLKVKAGEFVAIVGESGCGKSTLLRILLGFEQPESGAVYYDRQDLNGLNVAAVRRQIGIVLQSGRLMAASLLSNIIGTLPLGPDQAWDAARLAGLEEDIKDMPIGMHTMLSEGGGGISGGQRQRVLIARAIANRPRVIFFDEATSALDNRSQALISESVDRLKATRVVIAHRLSTIRNANRILVMQNGDFTQSGTYDELINEPGLFAELARRQTLS
jgi:ATP-binding cassette subfamily C protein